MFLQSTGDQSIKNIVRSLEKDIDSLRKLEEISIPEISSGYFVMLRVYPHDDFKYPALAKQVASYSKKKQEIVSSAKIELEDLFGKGSDEIYNIFLDRVIGTFFILEKKKIPGVNVNTLKTALESLYSKL